MVLVGIVGGAGCVDTNQGIIIIIIITVINIIIIVSIVITVLLLSSSSCIVGWLVGLVVGAGCGHSYDVTMLIIHH